MPMLPISGDASLNADGTDVVLIEGVDAIKQQITVGAQVFAGVWVYDRNVGIDWIEIVMRKGADYRVMRSTFWNFLLTIPGIVKVVRVDLRYEPTDRTLSIDYEAEALGGAPVVGAVSW